MFGRISCRNLCHGFGARHLQHALPLSSDPRQLHVHGPSDGADPMRLAQACSDERGASAVEFGLTAPIFFMFLFGIIECGLVLWTQFGLQHGAEMAARCASVNKIICGSVSDIQSYAAKETFGLNPAPSTFTISTPACGNQVSASYTFQFVTTYFGAPTLTISAQSCFPK